MTGRWSVVLATVVACLTLTGCVPGPEGIVYSRGDCGQSQCINVADGKGGSVPKRVSAGEYPGCIEGARWPDCKDGQR